MAYKLHTKPNNCQFRAQKMLEIKLQKMTAKDNAF